ncbi:MAG: TGS domain-containing protein [Asgard group archaeon]|nr:TGS domain-containing protein [Asgard group archaeon]
MNKITKIRWFRYKIITKLELLEGEELAEAIDELIEEIQIKKLDKIGEFNQIIIELLDRKAEALAKPKQKTRQYDPFDVPKSGVGRIALFGLSNVGKSTLMNVITNTEVTIGNYLHTTRVGQAGSCRYENVNFQIVDLPGFLDFKDDWDINKQIVRVARSSDAIMMVIDLTMDIDRQLDFLTDQLVKAKLLVDGLSGYKIAIIATKGDLPGSKENYQLLQQKTNWDIFPTAYNNVESLEKLKEQLFYHLELIRIYTKPPGEKPNFKEPFVIANGATVADVAEKIHSSFLQRFRYAKVWGTSCEFEGQQVGLTHELHDKDVIELVLQRQQPIAAQ